MPNRNQRDFGQGGGFRPGADARARAAAQRDAALDRVGSARRWVITGAAGLSAGFAALVYALAPGHALSSAHAATGGKPATSTSGTTNTSRNGEPAMPAPAGAAALGIGGSGGSSNSAPPAPAPAPSTPAPAASAPAPSGPPVSSGGS